MTVTAGDLWLQTNQGWLAAGTGTFNTVTVPAERLGNIFDNYIAYPTYTSTNTLTFDNLTFNAQLSPEAVRRMSIKEQVAKARATTRIHGDGANGYTWERYQEIVRREMTDLTDIECRAIEDGFQRGLEEHREAERQRAAMREEARQLQERRDQADRRAEQLLLSLLTGAERREWREHNWVTVRTADRVWRLHPAWAGGAALMDGDRERAVLCVHPRDRVPNADTVVALLMALRAGDEDHLLQTAILHHGEFTDVEHEIRGRRAARADADRYRLVRVA